MSARHLHKVSKTEILASMNRRIQMIDNSARLTIGKVKQYGVVGLYDGKKTDMQIASEATHAISEMDKRLLDVETLMISTLASDDSWESITYEVRAHEGMAMGHLVRIVKYKDFGGGDREDQVTYGPLVPVSKAEALLAVLNS
jgi:hypothetical protein